MNAPLREQIRQEKPFESLQAEVFLNLLRTYTVLMSDLVALLRLYHLTQPQYNVLRILRGAGDAGLPSGEIGARMVNREPDITRLLDRMKTAGLVARERQPTNRRIVRARLTPKGRRLVDTLDEPIRHMHARQLQRLSAPELRSLSALLEAARDGR